jgi:hypothetical protein
MRPDFDTVAKYVPTLMRYKFLPVFEISSNCIAAVATLFRKSSETGFFLCLAYEHETSAQL